MPYVNISQDIYDGLEDDFKSKLEIYKPEDTTKLKENANKILSEKKSLEVDLAQYKAAKNAKAGEGGDSSKYQAMLEDAESKLEESRKAYEGLQGEVRQKTLEGEAIRLATSMTDDTNRANLLKQQIMGRLTIDGDSFGVLDERGNPTISSIEELTGQIKTQYPFLVDGSKASGGGAKGSDSGAVSAKQISRDAFESMGQGERSAFIKTGGVLSDD